MPISQTPSRPPSIYTMNTPVLLSRVSEPLAQPLPRIIAQRSLGMSPTTGSLVTELSLRSWLSLNSQSTRSAALASEKLVGFVTSREKNPTPPFRSPPTSTVRQAALPVGLALV